MTARKSGRRGGLGKGLDALIPVDQPVSGFATINLDHITPNTRQPRERFDDEAIESLAASIREVGVLQPVVVRRGPDDTFTLVAGERRWRAARLAGLAEIPAVIRDSGDEATNLTEALIENIHREDLTPLEQGAAYRQLMEDFGLTQDEVAQRVGKARSTVTNTVRLLGLPASIQGLLESGALSAGHARPLLGLDDTAYAEHVGQKAAEEGWSVRQVEDAVRARNSDPSESKRRRSTPVRPAAIIELESRLAERLGNKVTIRHATNGSGRLVVNYRSLDDLERIYRDFLST